MQNPRMTDDHSPNAAWTANHFSQANPRGPGQEDVPALLRHVAETIAALGEVRILDIVMHNDVTTDGNWPSIVVYFKREDS
jgi:hypothetical protein